jgi:hypothetical protein
MPTSEIQSDEPQPARPSFPLASYALRAFELHAALVRLEGTAPNDAPGAAAVRPDILLAIESALQQLEAAADLGAPLPASFNPYGRLVSALAAGRSAADRRKVLTGLRPLLTSTFAYAVPSDEVLDRLAAYKEIVEIGAGRGFWARCLAARGARVHAYDIDVPDGHGRGSAALPPHFPVVRGGPGEGLAAHGDCPALLLCWPPGMLNRQEVDHGGSPRFSNMGEEALARFRGRNLVVVATLGMASFGPPAFWEALRRDWVRTEVVSLPNLADWQDAAHFFQRR